jgi:hypothetical protein
MKKNVIGFVLIAAVSRGAQDAPKLTGNYAIEAKVGGDLAGTKIDTLSEIGRSLVRSILDDKFKLQAHLEAHTGRQPTIVIDHIERPTDK